MAEIFVYKLDRNNMRRPGLELDQNPLSFVEIYFTSNGIRYRATYKNPEMTLIAEKPDQESYESEDQDVSDSDHYTDAYWSKPFLRISSDGCSKNEFERTAELVLSLTQYTGYPDEDYKNGSKSLKVEISGQIYRDQIPQLIESYENLFSDVEPSAGFRNPSGIPIKQAKVIGTTGTETRTVDSFF